MEGNKRVVIVGGGFGGLSAAKQLGKAPALVTLVDKSNHHLFQPLLYQVATATLSPADVAMPIRHILRRQQNTDVILAEVAGIDTSRKLVMLEDSEPLPYDYLILAPGNQYNYFGHAKWERIARGLKDIEDATFIRGEILAAFEYAERVSDPKEQAENMTFIIVGGGPTGVELAGAISELANKVLRGDFRHIKPGAAKIIIVEGGARVLAAYHDKLSDRAKRDLERLGVDIRLNTMVQEVDEHGVTTSTGRIEGRNVIWAAGVKAMPVADWLQIPSVSAGKVAVEPDLTVKGHPEMFVIGDCCHFVQDGHPLGGVAQVAIQQGAFVGKKITALLRSRSFDRQFRYRNYGELATIGRSRAIGHFGKVRIAGWFAWWAWLLIHIMKLVGFRNRVSVLVQWAWAYFTWDRGARLITPSEWASRRPQSGSPWKRHGTESGEPLSGKR